MPVIIKGLKLFKKIEASLLMKSKINDVLDEVGDRSVERIVTTTRRGKSLVDAKSVQSANKIKDVSDPYSKRRNKLKKFRSGDLSPFAPGGKKSNLTLTGQLLDAVEFSKNFFRKSVTVFVKDTMRRPTPSLSKKKKKKEKASTNKEVARQVSEKGRPFLGLDESFNKVIKSILLRELRSLLRKNNLRK